MGVFFRRFFIYNFSAKFSKKRRWKIGRSTKQFFSEISMICWNKYKNFELKKHLILLFEISTLSSRFPNKSVRFYHLNKAFHKVTQINMFMIFVLKEQWPMIDLFYPIILKIYRGVNITFKNTHWSSFSYSGSISNIMSHVLP